MSSKTSNSRTCPVCGSPNSAISLFCAECGSSLNAADTTATGRFAPPREGDSQATAAFEPLSSSSRREPVSTVTPIPRSSTNDTAWSAPALTPEPAAPLAVNYVAGENRPESIRGFVLGLIASVLILAVLLLWIWAAVLDASTRDSISNLFGFLN